MKKVTGLVLIILMAFIAVPAKSQLKFGVKGGLNISSVHLNSDILKADNVTGFQIDLMIETTIPLIGVGLDAAIPLFTERDGCEIGDRNFHECENRLYRCPGEFEMEIRIAYH